MAGHSCYVPPNTGSCQDTASWFSLLYTFAAAYFKMKEFMEITHRSTQAWQVSNAQRGMRFSKQLPAHARGFSSLWLPGSIQFAPQVLWNLDNVHVGELWRSQLITKHQPSATSVTYSPQDPSELGWDGPSASVPLWLHILGISRSLHTSLPWGIPGSISTRERAVGAGHLPRKQENLVLLTGQETAFSSSELQLPKGVPGASAQCLHTSRLLWFQTCIESMGDFIAEIRSEQKEMWINAVASLSWELAPVR